MYIKQIYKNSFVKTIHKNFMHGKKTIKWYWREINYEMNHNDIYKNYLIKTRDETNSSKLSMMNKMRQIFRNSLNTETNLEFLPLNNSGNPEYDSCLIWLYDGDHIEMFIEHLLEYNNFPNRNFKIVFMRAPFNPITFDSVTFQRSWFNIFDFPDASGNRKINKKEIEKFNKNIHREIKDQYNIIGDYNKIFLGGFSQSASMSLYSTLTYPENLGGTIAFNGFNFDFTPLDSDKKKIPILCVNGSRDEVVIMRHARNSYSNLIRLGFNITFIEEPGLGHYFTQTGLNYANKILSNNKIILNNY